MRALTCCWPCLSGTLFTFILSAAVLVTNPASCPAQGTLKILETAGAGGPLVSDVVSLPLAGFSSPVVQFEFGFATDEVVGPGIFNDALTVSFGDALFTRIALLATLDASGAAWLPPNPGGVFLPSAFVQIENIAYPSLAPQLTSLLAYRVRTVLPSELMTGPLNVTFDLFNNVNGVNSVGWYQSVLVLEVPEPGTVTLLLGGAVLVWLNWRERRRG